MEVILTQALDSIRIQQQLESGNFPKDKEKIEGRGREESLFPCRIK
jgi:hypothetical protein